MSPPQLLESSAVVLPSGSLPLEGLYISIGGASGGCSGVVGAPSTDPSCYGLLLPAGRPFAYAYPQCGRPPGDLAGDRCPVDKGARQTTVNDVRDGDEDDNDDDDGGGADEDNNNNNNNNDDHVGDMCGCATSTRRGLGTAAGKSARRAKSSCSVHKTPGIR